MTILRTTPEIFEVLGGVRSIADITKAKYGTAWNWKSFNRFPSRTYVAIQKALAAKGYRAPAALWGMTEGAEAAE